jgi:mRNA-degrading endonuclease RelE of RelBE toxin-antitoxin system
MLYFQFTASFQKDYRSLSGQDQDRVDRALTLLDLDWHHPGLHVKKVRGVTDVWEARISESHRLTFQITGKQHGHDVCILRRVGTHAILKKP